MCVTNESNQSKTSTTKKTKLRIEKKSRRDQCWFVRLWTNVALTLDATFSSVVHWGADDFVSITVAPEFEPDGGET